MAAEPAALFPRTRWTLIVAARESPEAQRRALDELLAIYWRPLYVYVRRKGLAPEEAQDVVQDLVVRLLEKEFLERLAPDKGKLRGYLKAAADHLLVNRHEKASAAKRGGGAPALDVDALERTLADAGPTPDEAYQREWAAQVMDRALARLQDELVRGGRQGAFEIVRAFFGGGEAPAYKDAAARWRMSVPALKAFLHRVRGRFRELVREEVADTVASAADADGECAELMRALAGGAGGGSAPRVEPDGSRNGDRGRK